MEEKVREVAIKMSKEDLLIMLMMLLILAIYLVWLNKKKS